MAPPERAIFDWQPAANGGAILSDIPHLRDAEVERLA